MVKLSQEIHVAPMPHLEFNGVLRHLQQYERVAREFRTTVISICDVDSETAVVLLSSIRAPRRSHSRVSKYEYHQRTSPAVIRSYLTINIAEGLAEPAQSSDLQLSDIDRSAMANRAACLHLCSFHSRTTATSTHFKRLRSEQRTHVMMPIISVVGPRLPPIAGKAPARK
jgi:hypothetical protein